MSEPDSPSASFKRFSKGLMTRGYRTRSPRKNLGVLTPESLIDRYEEARSVYTQSPLSRFQDGSTSGGGFFGSSSEILSPIGETQSRTFKVNFSKGQCCLCDELLTESLPGEQALQLTCDHTCHYNCFVVLLDKHSLNQLPYCPKCRLSTRPSDDHAWENMTNATLLQDQQVDGEISPQVLFANSSRDGDEPVTPVECTAVSLMDNSSSMTHNPPPSTDDENGPQISFKSSLSKVIIASDSPCRLKCYLSVKNPTCAPVVDTELKEENSQTRECIELDILESIGHLMGEVSPASFGRLVIFDYAEVSQDEELWESMQCVLFESFLVLVCKSNPSLSAFIDTKRDLVSVDSCEDSLCLTLSTGLVSCPEILLKFESVALLKKWRYYSSSCIQDQIPFWTNQPAAHLSTNAWDSLTDPSLVPLEFRQSEHLFEGPMTPVTPRWEPTQNCLGQPSMLSILIIPLINKSGLTLPEYETKIRQTVNLFLESLGEADKFGLVKIGRDELGRKSNSATFVGCVNRSWEGWNDVTNDIEAYNDDGKMAFQDSSEEVAIGLKYCEQLLSSVLDSETMERDKLIKKVFFLNCSSQKLSESFQSTSSEAVRDVLHRFVSTWKVSISLLQVGKHYSAGMLSMLECAKSFQNDEIRCIFATESQRFENLSSMLADVKSIVHHSKKVALPELTIQIAACSGVCIKAVEMSDQSMSSDSTNLDVELCNLSGETERIIMVELELVVGPHSFNNGAFCDFPLVSISSCSKGESKSFTAHAQVGVSFSPTNTIGQLALTNDEDEELYMDIPLLPPLSIQRDTSYIKRQIELLVSQQLSLWLKTGDTTSLADIVSVIWGMTRGYSSSVITLKEKKIKLNDYVEILIGKVNSIVDAVNLKDEYSRTLAHDLYAELHF